MKPPLMDSARRGIGVMFALVVIAVFGVISGCAMWQILAGRQALDRRADLVQARWLARSGIEAAADRLLAEPPMPDHETLTVLSDGDVVVTVRPVVGRPNRFEIHAVGAVFGADGKKTQSSLHAVLERIDNPLQVRLHVLDEFQPGDSADSRSNSQTSK